MSRRLTISGIEHIVRLINQYPQLLGLSSFSPINQVARQAKEAVIKGKCGCRAAPVYAANRGVFETALHSMKNGDHLTIKKIMNVDELCYYSKDSTGRYVLNCI